MSRSRAFDELYYLERACQAQLQAESTGRRLRIVPGLIAPKTGRQIVDDLQYLHHFEALKRMLDRDGPSQIETERCLKQREFRLFRLLRIASQ
ncbi:MAG: hypothetical protein SF339_06880 [Blastocatellia bacterium]|nr:hypothetical protein [Blastocatellia bacterium]